MAPILLTYRSSRPHGISWSSTLYGEIFVKGVPQESYPIYLRSVSLFDLVAVSSSRPTRRRAGARRGGQGWPHLGGHRRLGLGRHRARRQTWPCRDDDRRGARVSRTNVRAAS